MYISCVFVELKFTRYNLEKTPVYTCVHLDYTWIKSCGRLIAGLSKQKALKGQPKLNFSGAKPQTKQAVKKSRPDSEASNSSMEEFQIIQTQLQTMTDTITSLRYDLKCMLKKEEVEQLITNTVTSLMNKIEQNMNNKIEKLVREKLVEVQSKIESLDYEKNNLKDQFKRLEDKTSTNAKSMNEQ
ncbi:hypothetical protein DPMN_009687 [Dreissena polymorpha]|uniref:Uncharacterized protein n=1 Tax=Dreissena polymorpha TaxID=45954 RepID=A0A9D4RYD0_DREPO|nr:hypothetical protein DPMN_009687 [Dreissena polymorpha]